jgi:hypothetical protein
MMTLIPEPWARVRERVEMVLGTEELKALPELEFAQMVRQNLDPAGPSKEARWQWNQLWEALRGDEDLTDRAYGAIEEFLKATDRALASGELDEAQTKRAKKFKLQAESAWNRVDRPKREGALAWAGAAGDFAPNAQRVISILVGAVAKHRAAVSATDQPTGADLALWAALRKVGLDPADYPSYTD